MNSFCNMMVQIVQTRWADYYPLGCGTRSVAAGVTTDEWKSMCVADGTRRPSMRARTPAKLDPFARCRAPHHGPQSRRRSSFSGHEKRRAPSLPSYEAICAVSARARPFSLRLVSPRGALPLRCSPVSVSVSVCSEESRLFHGHFRIREGYDQTRGKNSGKHILTTFLEISGRDFDFRYVTFISLRDVLNVGVSARDVLNVGF